jgi:hypothetical protein
MNNSMKKYNIVMCCYDKILVNVAAYVIPGKVCVCVCVCVFACVCVCVCVWCVFVCGAE